MMSENSSIAGVFQEIGGVLARFGAPVPMVVLGMAHAVILLLAQYYPRENLDTAVKTIIDAMHRRAAEIKAETRKGDH